MAKNTGLGGIEPQRRVPLRFAHVRNGRHVRAGPRYSPARPAPPSSAAPRRASTRSICGLLAQIRCQAQAPGPAGPASISACTFSQRAGCSDIIDVRRPPPGSIAIPRQPRSANRPPEPLRGGPSPAPCSFALLPRLGVSQNAGGGGGGSTIRIEKKILPTASFTHFWRGRGTPFPLRGSGPGG